MNLNSFLLVGAGGAIGSMLRFAISLITTDKLFPYTTFIVNILGSLVIGVLFGLIMKNNLSNNGWRFMATGLCGGFTTFSALSLEGLELIQAQRYYIFLLYFLLSVTVGIGAAFLGYTFTK